MKLPAKLFVRWEPSEPSKDTPWLQAEKTLDAVMDDNGPFDVGVYGLLEVQRVEKVVKIVTVKKSRTDR